jgi:AmiR/NasT family two-component response regulator
MSSQSHIRVLLAEDDAMVSEMIKGQLGEIGCTVAGEASNGARALELAEALRPDVVLMDIKMPDMDGLETTRRLMKGHPVPVVVLTAYDTPELVEEASEVGVGGYLVKPTSARELERAIMIARARFHDMMELRRKNTELEEALAWVKQLSGLLPICASCKKIRDDEGYWHQVEVYIRDHSEAQFSHGLCPDCMTKLYPTLFEDEDTGGESP